MLYANLDLTKVDFDVSRAPDGDSIIALQITDEERAAFEAKIDDWADKTAIEVEAQPDGRAYPVTDLVGSLTPKEAFLLLNYGIVRIARKRLRRSVAKKSSEEFIANKPELVDLIKLFAALHD